MKTQLIQSGGIQQTAVAPQTLQQIIYLDFDGELTSYNGETLTIDHVEVSDSRLTPERIAAITAALNEKFADLGVTFVTEPPAHGEYSTIYVGRTSAFEQYGSFAGLAETVDSGNQIKNDNAFVMLDSTSGNARIVEVIAHEAGHLLGTLDHGGNGLTRYAKSYDVSSGVTSTGIKLSEYDSMFVSAGGTANQTTVNYWGYLDISSGGVANNTTVNSYGSMYVSSGGTATGTTVNSNGYLYISSGSVANNTTVNWRGYVLAYNGGSISALTLKQEGRLGGFSWNEERYFDQIVNGSAVIAPQVEIIGSRLDVYSGGVATNTTVTDHGSMYIFSGGTATDTTVYYGAMYIFGGTANDTTVNNGGNLWISSGGVANSTTMSGGYLYVSNGGLANNTTVNYYGIMFISSGGVATNTTVNTRGSMHISNGGTATAIKENGGYVDVEKGANVTFIANTFSGLVLRYGNATLHSGTTAVNTTVSDEGYLFISSGGVATGITVNSGGSMYISSGGTATNIIAQNGVILNLTVAPDTYIQGKYGSSAFVMQNAYLSGYTLNSGGSMYISSGGFASGTTVNMGCYMCISSGGVANSTTVNSRGGVKVYSGGVANSTTVNSYGSMYISSGGTATAVKENGGYVEVAKGANVTFIANTFSGLVLRGYATLHSGTTATDTTVNYCGSMYIYSGGVATAIKENGGYVYVADGANVTFVANTFSGLVLSSYNRATLHSGTTANNTTVNGYCQLYVCGGVANNTTVNGGMYISSGGVANNTTVSRYGSMYVSSGGTATGTTVNSSGYLYISSGGTANDVVVNSAGYVFAYEGGNVSALTLKQGGQLGGFSWSEERYFDQIVNGSAVIAPNVEITEYRMDVYSGGTADQTTVNSRGSMYISSGGVANTIVNGGYLYISSGGVANNTTVNYYGVMYISNGGIHSGSLQIAGRAVVSAYQGAIIDFTVAGQTAPGTALINNWSLINGGANAGYTLTIKADQTAGTYLLAAGAANFNKTITVKTVDNTQLGTLSVGTTLEVNEIEYTLQKENGSLSLVVSPHEEVKLYSSGTLVSAAQIMTGKTVASGGNDSMFVSSGGTANDTTVNNGGNLWISSGGTAAAVKENGGYVEVANGANVTFVANTFSGLVLSNGRATLHSGTTANNTTVNDGGSMYISRGGLASGTTVNSRGGVNVYSGGTANSTTVNDGYLYISRGGVANSTTVSDGGFVYISSGGVANSTTVSDGGFVYISSGGTATNIIAQNGAGLGLTVAPDTYIQGEYGSSAFVIQSAYLSGYTVNSRGDLYISSGGTAAATTVNNGGYLCIFSGGTATAIKENGGYVDVAKGADVTFIANTFSGLSLDYGSATLHSGTTATDTTVNGYGSMYVFSGGVANSTTVNSYGSMYIDRGGIHSGSLQIAGGAVVSAYQGAIIDFTVAEQTAPGTALINNWSLITGCADADYTLTVKANQAAGTYLLAAGAADFNKTITVKTVDNAQLGTLSVGTTLEVGGMEYTLQKENGNLSLVVSGTSPHEEVKLYSSGTLVSAAQIMTGQTVTSGGNDSMFVSSGGTANNTTVKDWGELYISGGTANQTTVNGGSMYVFSGGTATGTTMSDGQLYISGGGTAVNTTVNWGYLHVSSGGTASITTVNDWGYLRVSGGGVASSTTVYDFGCLDICSGATANSTIVNSWGRLSIFSGGLANQTTVNSYGSMYISSGGTAAAVKENGGYVEVAKGANVTFVANTLSGLVLNYNGSATLHSGTTANNTTVNNGNLFICNGGVANSTTVAANYWDGGSACLYVSGGGTANQTTVNFGGNLYISSGGTATGTTMSDGQLYISSGGTAVNTTVNYGVMHISGGTATVTTVDFLGCMYVDRGGTANDTTVDHEGYLCISGGGIASNTTVNVGHLYVYGGGVASRTTVTDWSFMYISSGGTANDTTVNNGGNLWISSGGTAAVVKENGGYVEVEDGANVTFIANTFSGLSLDYGSATLHSGTTATDTTVNYGNLFIYNGGLANNTAVNGSMFVSGGGVANNTTVNDYGSMYISSGGIHSGSLQIAGGAVVSAYQGASIDFTVAEQTAPGTALVNNWSLINGGSDADYTLTVKTEQSEGAYLLAAGAADFNKTITVKTVDNTQLGTLSVGTTLEVSEIKYTLQKENGSLSLVVSAAPPHEEVKLYSSGTLVSAAQIMTGKTVASGGNDSMFVSSGGVATDTTVNTSGYLYISSGGTATGTTVNEGYLYISSGGMATDTAVNNGGYLCISSGGTATAIKENGGYVHVAKGANVTFAANTLSGLLLSSDSATLHSGTTANNTTINYDGAMLVSSGGTANSTTVNSNGRMHISSGGTAAKTTLNNGGSMFISSGGIAAGTTVNSCGNMYICDGGTATGIKENGGYVDVAAGANVAFEVNSFSGLVLDNQSATVHSGTTAAKTTLNGGYLEVYNGGVANNTTVSDWGFLFVENGGTVNSTIINCGDLYVSSGGMATGTTVNFGGRLCISHGGTATAVKENGGYVEVANDANVTFAANTLSGLLLSRDSATLHSGTVANRTTVNSRGYLNVCGGKADSTTVNYGSMYISSGGVATNTTVNLLGSMYISSGGVANSTTVNSKGQLFVSSGGTADNTIINSRGQLYITGGAAGNAVLNGATVTFTGDTVNMKTAKQGSGNLWIFENELEAEVLKEFAADAIIFKGETVRFTQREAAAPGPLDLTGIAISVDCALPDANTTLVVAGDVVNADKVSSFKLHGVDVNLTGLTDTVKVDGYDYKVTYDTASLSITVNAVVQEAATAGGIAENPANQVAGGYASMWTENTRVSTAAFAAGSNSVDNIYLNLAGVNSENIILGGGDGRECASREGKNDIKLTAGTVSTIYGGGFNQDQAAVEIKLDGGTVTGDVFGGSRITAGTHSVESVAMTVDQSIASEGRSIYGAGFAAGENVVLNNAETVIGIAGGNLGTSTAGEGVFGGGFAANGAQVNTGNVTIGLTGGTVGNVFGAGWAQQGGKVSVDEVNIAVTGTEKGGVIFGGGAHSYQSGGNTEVGTVNITVASANGFGSIYAGGQINTNGGDSVGSSTVTVTGSDTLTNNFFGQGLQGLQTVADGKSLLLFSDFTGSVCSKIADFDFVELSGNTTADLTGAVLNGQDHGWILDFTGRAVAKADETAADFTNVSGEFELQVNAGLKDAASWQLISAELDSIADTWSLGISYNGGAIQQVALGETVTLGGTDWELQAQDVSTLDSDIRIVMLSKKTV